MTYLGSFGPELAATLTRPFDRAIGVVRIYHHEIPQTGATLEDLELLDDYPSLMLMLSACRNSTTGRAFSLDAEAARRFLFRREGLLFNGVIKQFPRSRTQVRHIRPSGVFTVHVLDPVTYP